MSSWFNHRPDPSPTPQGLKFRFKRENVLPLTVKKYRHPLPSKGGHVSDRKHESPSSPLRLTEYHPTVDEVLPDVLRLNRGGVVSHIVGDPRVA